MNFNTNKSTPSEGQSGSCKAVILECYSPFVIVTVFVHLQPVKALFVVCYHQHWQGATKMPMTACPWSVTVLYWVCILTNDTIILSQASLKKFMTMLGCVRRCRQADDDPTLDGRRPASSTRGSDFCKALMVEAHYD
jgi:hypothetical protein